LALGKQANRAPYQQGIGFPEQLGKRRKSPRGHGLNAGRWRFDEIRDPGRMDDNRRADRLRGVAEEGGFFGAAFDQMHLRTREVRKGAGDHQTRKARA
jgi:hypothetical protein